MLPSTASGTKNLLNHIRDRLGKKMFGQKDDVPMSKVRSGLVACIYEVSGKRLGGAA
jgi:hypothetical protein